MTKFAFQYMVETLTVLANFTLPVERSEEVVDETLLTLTAFNGEKTLPQKEETKKPFLLM